MVLHILGAAYNSFFPQQYAVHVLVAALTILVLHAFSQGRKTNRDRDLHARTILVTGGFTPLGITLLQSLAQRGAHIIALSPESVDSPRVSILIDLIRTTCANEHVFAEHCDLASPASVRAFCTRFLTGTDQRLDALVFAHEYQHVGPFAVLSAADARDVAVRRESASLATFLMTTLLLPALLVAPAERDIRIVTVVNPFYAAASGPHFSIPFSLFTFTSTSTPPRQRATSIFLQEGTRALRTIVLTRHLQRVLDALPAQAQVPKTEESSSAVPVVSPKTQKSNIVAVSVSPGISRADTVAPLLNADSHSPYGYSYLGLFLYVIFQPVLRIFTKSPVSSIQTILHALFLPTPFKLLSQSTSEGQNIERATGPTSKEEVLKPGALYSECGIVGVKVPVPDVPPEAVTQDEKGKGKGKHKEKEKGIAKDVLEIKDDGEFGGELMGRLVWEAYEDALKAWEKLNPVPEEEKVVNDATGDEARSVLHRD